MTDLTLSPKTPNLRIVSIDSEDQLQLVKEFLTAGKLLFDTENEQKLVTEFSTETGILPAGLVIFKEGDIFSVVARLGDHFIISDNGYAYVAQFTFETPFVEGDTVFPSKLFAKFWEH